MKVSEYISLLNDFKGQFGDAHVEFWLRDNEEGDSLELQWRTLRAIEPLQRNNSGPETVCEIVLSDIG